MLKTNMQLSRKIKQESRASDNMSYFLRLGLCFLSTVFATSSIIIMHMNKKIIADMLFSKFCVINEIDVIGCSLPTLTRR